MLALRQPQDFRSGKFHQLFVDYRYNLVRILTQAPLVDVPK